MWCSLLPVCMLFVATLADFDYYDINVVADMFDVKCGNNTNKEMTITYGGNAHSVYADPETCAAIEVAPAIHQIADATLNAGCDIQNYTSPELTTLEVVVQEKKIRKVTDQVYLITCNYEFGGQQQSSEKGAIQGTVAKVPIWETAADKQATSNTSLHVYDTSDSAITSTTLGNYIQLRAFMTQAGSEVSFKIWNCRGYNDDTDQSYYMLLGGCGDGDIIASNRGFETRNESISFVDRVSRSTYYHAFLLPGASTIQFECDYVVCENNDCDGRSCLQPLGNRKRRQVAGEENLPKITSPVIRIAPAENVVTADDLLRGSEFAVPVLGDLHNNLELGKTSIDTLTVGLIAGLVILAVVLIVSIACALIAFRRLEKPKAVKYEKQPVHSYAQPAYNQQYPAKYSHPVA